MALDQLELQKLLLPIYIALGVDWDAVCQDGRITSQLRVQYRLNFDGVYLD